MVRSADIVDAAITTAKIVDAAITSAKIGDAEVNTLKIAGNAVTVEYANSARVSSTGLTGEDINSAYTFSGLQHTSYDYTVPTIPGLGAEVIPYVITFNFGVESSGFQGAASVQTLRTYITVDGVTDTQTHRIAC